jgi:hypothetical protein
MTHALGRALACAACRSTAAGDRSSNWVYGALIAAPFLVAITLGAVLAWAAGYRRRWHRATSMATPINEEVS